MFCRTLYIELLFVNIIVKKIKIKLASVAMPLLLELLKFTSQPSLYWGIRELFIEIDAEQKTTSKNAKPFNKAHQMNSLDTREINNLMNE